MKLQAVEGVGIGAGLMLAALMFSTVSSVSLERSVIVLGFTAGMYLLAAWVHRFSSYANREAIVKGVWYWLPGMLALHIMFTAEGARLWSPTALANYACLVFFTALALRNWLWVGVAAVVIVLAGSRGAWLNLTAGIVMLAVAEPDLMKHLLKAKWLAVVAAPVLAYQATRDFERVSIWQTGVEMYRAAPVFGMGPGTFGLFNPYPDAHNIVLNLLAESGVVGLCAACVLALMLAARVRERMQEPLMRGIAAALVGTLAAGLIGVPTYEIPVNIGLAVLIGMVL